MALRIKTKYRTKGPKTIEDRASVVAANVWKIAQEMLRRMEVDGYALGQDRQVNAMLTEFMAFLMQIADRLVYGHLSEEERSRFINAGPATCTHRARQYDGVRGGGRLRPTFY